MKFLRSLHRKKVREEEGLLLVEGLTLVEEAVSHGRVREILLSPEMADGQRGRALARIGPPVTLLASEEVAELAETETPSGAFAVVEDPCARFAPKEFGAQALILLAAGVGDPGNLGTLIRTAGALGVDGVVTTPGTVEATNPKAVRASAGAIFRLPVRHGGAQEVKAAGFTLLLADARGRAVSSLAKRPARCALAVGSEPHGLGPEIRAIADGEIGIPLHRGVESLNVAVAAGILLYHLRGLPVARS